MLKLFIITRTCYFDVRGADWRRDWGYLQVTANNPLVVSFSHTILEYLNIKRGLHQDKVDIILESNPANQT